MHVTYSINSFEMCGGMVCRVLAEQAHLSPLHCRRSGNCLMLRKVAPTNVRTFIVLSGSAQLCAVCLHGAAASCLDTLLRHFHIQCFH